MKKTFFKIIYTWLFLPLAIIRILFKSYKNPQYVHRLNERFAIFKSFSKPVDIWLHMVSVGEFIAAKSLIDELLITRPGIRLLLTTTTPTGSELVLKYIAQVNNANNANKANTVNSTNIFHVYYPYDVTFICRRFLHKIMPKKAVFFETEIWPKMFYEIKKQDIKLYIINARLSEKSYKGYAYIRDIIKHAINKVDFIATQGVDDKQRFLELGCKKDKIEVFGNIKYNLKLPQDLNQISINYKAAFGKTRPILIAASTHAGEEEIIINIFNNIKQQFGDLLLIIAPRHPERFNDVYNLCSLKKLNIIKYTDLEINTDINAGLYSAAQVFLLNTLGKLLYFYNISDVAFIGGSFADIGGHNPIEAAALQIPIITGPNYYNFTEIVRDLECNKGIIIANTIEELESNMVALLSNSELRNNIALAAINSLKKHQEVLDKYLHLIL